jgi:hypothetical protein
MQQRDRALLVRWGDRDRGHETDHHCDRGQARRARRPARARSHLTIEFALRGAADTRLAVANGIALYEHALDGGDVVERATAEGTEDYVVFERAPARSELWYDVDVSRVAGLRLVENTLEFLDAGGVPRLRVAPPAVVDESGERHPATLALSGCAFVASRR